MTSRDEARTAINEALIAVPLGIRSPVSDMVDAVWPVVDELITDGEKLRFELHEAIADLDNEREFRTAERAAAQAALEALQTENEKLRTALEVCLPVVVFVSRGRGYVGCETYPDATARRANFLVGEILFKNTVDARALLGSPKEGN